MKYARLFLFVFLGIWYYLSYLIFFNQGVRLDDSPSLRTRLGTILWHSSDLGGEEHTYCYYPKGSTEYPKKGGEYIIKREDSGNCEGFYGQAIFAEGSWVSEREKIWWSKDQRIEEELAKLEQKNDTL